MASSAAMSAARSMPTVYTVPLGPRVRPPRLLPGTKAENTNPQPDGPVPDRKVWVQGRWRDQNSKAAKDRKNVQSSQVEKALRHASHGMNIYAYRQIRTNQVVYSLTRVMQNNKILSQLIYHGKQTKPAALRRDVWRPYFSIHFPQTKAGAQAGLDTYQLLREFSARRQLSPPEGSLLATKEDVQDALKKYDPATLERMREENDKELSRLPRYGQLLPPKYRARRLMDQKKSSVADVAFALSLVNDSTLSPHAKLLRAQQQLKERHSDRSRRDRKRINEIRRGQDAKSIQIGDRQTLIDAGLGQLSLDKHAAARITLDHNGVLRSADRVTDLEDMIAAKSSSSTSEAALKSTAVGKKPPELDIDSLKKDFTSKWEAQHADAVMKPPFPTEELDALVQKKVAERHAEIEAWEKDSQQYKEVTDVNDRASRQVLMLWSDLKDAMNAEKWTSNVQHDWFDAKAVVKKQKSVVRQPAFIDEDGVEIAEQKQTRLFQVSSSPHIIGRDVSENWLNEASKLTEIKDTSDQESNLARREYVIQNIIEAKSELRTAAESGSDKLAGHQRKVTFMSARYPEYVEALDNLEYFADVIARQRQLAKEVEALRPGDEGRQELMTQEHALAKEIRDYCDIEFPGYSAAEKQHQEALLKSPSESRLEELETSSNAMKVRTVLANHRKKLERLDDESASMAARGEDGTTGPSSTTHNTSRQIDRQDLKTMNIEVDSKELDKRGVWSKVRGVFGR